MKLKPIRNEADSDAAVAAVSRSFDRPPRLGSAERDRFDILLTLIDAWEDRQHPIEAADPIDVIELVMQSVGYTQVDLGRLLGSRARASEILARKRRLTLAMIWKLSVNWKIPADALVTPYDLASARRRQRAPAPRRERLRTTRAKAA